MLTHHGLSGKVINCKFASASLSIPVAQHSQSVMKISTTVVCLQSTQLISCVLPIKALRIFEFSLTTRNLHRIRQLSMSVALAFWERSPASILKVIQGLTYGQAWEHHYLPERPHMLGSRLVCL